MLALEGDQLLLAGHRLAVALDQLGLVVPGIEVAARPGAEDHEHPLGLRREVRRARRERRFRQMGGRMGVDSESASKPAS